MPGEKGMTHYSREIKLKVVRLYIEEGKKQAEIAEQLAVREHRLCLRYQYFRSQIYRTRHKHKDMTYS